MSVQPPSADISIDGSVAIMADASKVKFFGAPYVDVTAQATIPTPSIVYFPPSISMVPNTIPFHQEYTFPGGATALSQKMCAVNVAKNIPTLGTFISLAGMTGTDACVGVGLRPSLTAGLVTGGKVNLKIELDFATKIPVVGMNQTIDLGAVMLNQLNAAKNNAALAKIGNMMDTDVKSVDYGSFLLGSAVPTPPPTQAPTLAPSSGGSGSSGQNGDGSSINASGGLAGGSGSNGAIIGGAVAGCVLLVGMVTAFVIMQRKNQRAPLSKSTELNTTTTPKSTASSSSPWANKDALGHSKV